jgi:hypothetical protein
MFAEKDRFFWDLGVDSPQLKPIPRELERLHEDHENMLSHWGCYYAPMFEQTVRRMGHEYAERQVDVREALRGIDMSSINFSDMVSEDDVLAFGPYAMTPNITIATYRDLCQQRKRGLTNADDVLKIKKFEFDLECDSFPFGADPDKRALVFAKFLADKSAERMHQKIACEFADRSQMLLEIAAFRPYADVVEKAKTAVGHVRNMCRILGLAHTFDTDTIVPRETIENNLQALNKEAMEAIGIMRLMDMCDTKELSFEVVLSNIQAVLGHWSGTHLVDQLQRKNNHPPQSMKVYAKKTVNACLARIWLGVEESVDVEPDTDAKN